LHDRYITGGKLSPEEQDRLAEITGATFVPDLREMVMLERNAEPNTEYTDQEWEALGNYWAITEGTNLNLGAQDQPNEVDELIYRYRTGKQVSIDEKAYMESYLTNDEWVELMQERTYAIEQSGVWEYQPPAETVSITPKSTSQGWIQRLIGKSK
jgi:hypothetical protein